MAKVIHDNRTIEFAGGDEKMSEEWLIRVIVEAADAENKGWVDEDVRNLVNDLVDTLERAQEEETV